MSSSTPTPLYPALALLWYMHAPTVGLFFLGATAFSLCKLRNPIPVAHRRRTRLSAIATLILLSHATEVLYYFRRSLADAQYTAPKPAAIRCLGSILVWGPFAYTLWTSKLLRWHPYLGAFVLQVVFETTTCFMSAALTLSEERLNNTPLALSCVRVSVSLILLIDSFVVTVTKHAEGTSEEDQSLLTKPTDNVTAQYDNTGYGSIEQNASEDEEQAPADMDKALRELQAERLEEEGGWYGYLRSFAIFLPDLFPRDDWMVMGALGVRFVHMLAGRALNLLAPRQLGIITNELTRDSSVMPWKDVGLWVLFQWSSSYAGLGFVNAIASVIIARSASSRITLSAYEHVLGLSMDFHTSKDSGEVLKAVEQAHSLNSLVEVLLFQILPIFLDLVVAMWYITHLFDAYMAFVILSMGFVYTCIGWYFTTLSQPKKRDLAEKQRTESSTVNEIVRNWQTVAYFNHSTYEYSRYAARIANTVRAQYAYHVRFMGGIVAQDMLMVSGFAACCVLGMRQIVAGRKQVGDLVTLIMYWRTMTSPLHVLSNSHRLISSCLINAERLLQLLKTKPSVVDREGARDLVVESGVVEFTNVEFAYDERKPIIRGVDLRAEGGQTIAFVGATGVGKSTILKLLFRFYDVTGGTITIDGQDLRSVTQTSLRDALGLVPQDPALFNQTIRQNVRYARLDATNAEVEDACRAAAVHNDIVGFPDGYSSKVGERGVRLSGGQLQRIAIARLFLKRPKIVLLDEATSAIDSGTEALIQGAFRKLSRGRTTFVIAHRLSTIVDADQILVMEKGAIVERGRHEELIEKSGKYSELWAKQTAAR